MTFKSTAFRLISCVMAALASAVCVQHVEARELFRYNPFDPDKVTNADRTTRAYEEKGIAYPLSVVETMEDYGEIADSARKALSIVPFDAFAMNILSEALFNLDRPREAMDMAFLSMETSDEDYEAYNLLSSGSTLDPQYLLSKTLPAIEKIRACANPTSIQANNLPTFMFLSAEAYLENEEIPEAYRMLKELMKTEQGHPDVANLMATVMLASGNAPKAEKLLKPIIDDFEFAYKVYDNYALSLRDSGKGDKALEFYRKLREDFDDLYDVDYASMLADLGKDDEALQIYSRYIKKHDDYLREQRSIGVPDPDPQWDNNYVSALLRSGIIYMKRGDKAAATEKFNAAMETCLAYGLPTGYEATICAWLGDKAGMEKWMKEYTSNDSFYKAALYYAVGDREKALEYLAEAFDKHTVCPDRIIYAPDFPGIAELPEYKALVKNYRPLKLD